MTERWGGGTAPWLAAIVPLAAMLRPWRGLWKKVGPSHPLATSRTLDVHGIVQITPVQVCIARMALSALTEQLRHRGKGYAPRAGRAGTVALPLASGFADAHRR